MSVKIYDREQKKWMIFPGTIGASGRSAYELAVQQGYKGDLNEWLLSLKGTDAYAMAVEGGYKGTKEEFYRDLAAAPIAVDKINSADAQPVENSNNLVLSGGVKEAINSLSEDISEDLKGINDTIAAINDNITDITDTGISTQIKNSIVDNLTSSDVDKSLSANQGKILKGIIDNLAGLQISVVENLPSAGENNIIYLIPKEGTETDTYNEYVYVEDRWEKIGSTDINLSDYYTKQYIDDTILELNDKISTNSSSISNITNNGSIVPKSLTIQRNNDPILNSWNGSTEETINITVPTNLDDLNVTKEDIVDVLGYTPADSISAGSGDVTGPSSAINENFVSFNGTTGKLIKDSKYNANSFAVKNHTHTVSEITDFPDIPESITVDSNLDETSEHPVQNSVITEHLNRKVDTTALEDYYTKDQTYTKNEIDNKIGSAGGGDVMTSGDLVADQIILGAGNKSIKDSGKRLSDLVLKSEISGYATQDWVTEQGYSTKNTWRPINVGGITLDDNATSLTITNGTGIDLSFADGTLTISSNSSSGSEYILPTASDSTLGGIKLGTTDMNVENTVPLKADSNGNTYVEVTDTTVCAALGYIPANIEDIPAIPEKLPNPLPLSLTWNDVTTVYDGNKASIIDLDGIYSKRLNTLTNPADAGKPGIFFTTDGATQVNIVARVTKDRPDAIIIVPGTTPVTLDESTVCAVQKIESLLGPVTGSYKCFCITWVAEAQSGLSKDLILINGAIYG